MSAFVVEDRTINEIVGILWSDLDFEGECGEILTGAQVEPSDPDPELLAKTMFTLNVDAVNQRYGPNQAKESRPLDFKWHWEKPSEIQALKSLHCFLYQCAEGDVPETRLYQALENFSHRLASRIISKLPEYDKARWS